MPKTNTLRHFKMKNIYIYYIYILVVKRYFLFQNCYILLFHIYIINFFSFFFLSLIYYQLY
jgi:hypothetical protein